MTERERLLEAAIPHVVFDGWSAETLRAAAVDAGIDPALLGVICPRGAVDLAVDYHRAGDRQMAERLAQTDVAAMRYRDRVAAAVRFRLEAVDREVVRRGAALFALPQHMATGARLVWQTADAIWQALGDRSDDINWYSKRLSLSAVYSSTALFWLGDDSAGSAATWDFLDRRIEDVMRFEKTKADFKASPLGRLSARPMKLLDRVHAPRARQHDDLPGGSR